MPKFIDKTGWIMKEHGVPDSRLTVLYRAPNQGKKVCWHVKCECGKEFDLRGDSLEGNTLSCGCLHKENFKRSPEDLTGLVFGLLTAQKVVNKHRVCWLCKCQCGNTTIVAACDLKSGHTRSCGCLASVGESNIMQILQENNITYIHDKPYFLDLVNPETNKILRYDFILFQNNIPIRIIEFDGEQHQTGWSHKEENRLALAYRDELKNNYAHEHGIPIVRIPHNERDNITLDLIMGDKYLIT